MESIFEMKCRIVHYDEMWLKTDAEGGGTRGGQRGQDNFKLAANFGYNSRGSADPRESLRKRRILKLALTAHKVLSAQALLPAAVL